MKESTKEFYTRKHDEACARNAYQLAGYYLAQLKELGAYPWVLTEDEEAIALDEFSIYASESGMTLDHTDNDMEAAEEQWLLEANYKKVIGDQLCQSTS